MDLRSPYPYWLLRHGSSTRIPRCRNIKKVDMAMICAGISGATAVWQLTRSGHKVAIVDRRHVGTASTFVSTFLLQL